MTWSGFTGKKIYLDTNILVFAIEQGNPWAGLLAKLFAAIDERAIHAFTSELTLAEVLVKPLQVGARDLVETYETLLAPASLIKVMAVDRAVLRAAAELRARLAVKLADAIHLATAALCQCDFVISNDERLGRKAPAELRFLSLEMVASQPSQTI